MFDNDFLSEDSENSSGAGSGSVEGTSYSCAYCGVENHTFVDPSQGENQQYTEDCQTCCNPNILRVHHDQWEDEWMISSEQEY